VPGDEIDLGAAGVFKVSSSGNLDLRCRKGWRQLPAESGYLSFESNVSENARETNSWTNCAPSIAFCLARHYSLSKLLATHKNVTRGPNRVREWSDMKL
jgi:hypothetical protein